MRQAMLGATLRTRLAPAALGSSGRPRKAAGSCASITAVRAGRVVAAASSSGADNAADRPQRRRTVALSSASAEAELAPRVWSQYVQQQQAPARAPGAAPFLLPLLIFPLCELPTETLTIPVQGGCYVRMFGLVEGSASRLFGVALADPEAASMESAGALCELTHCVRAPKQGLLLVAARVVGRFQTQRVLGTEPFVTVLAHEYSDALPADEFEALQLAAQERRVWHELLQVFTLGDQLLGLLTGRMAACIQDLSENPEILRWSPSSAARSAVPAAAAADTAMLAQVDCRCGRLPACSATSAACRSAPASTSARTRCGLSARTGVASGSALLWPRRWGWTCASSSTCCILRAQRSACTWPRRCCWSGAATWPPAAPCMTPCRRARLDEPACSGRPEQQAAPALAPVATCVCKRAPISGLSAAHTSVCHGNLRA